MEDRREKHRLEIYYNYGMYYLFADETNTTPKYDRGVKFFIYGGLIVPADQLSSIDSEIRKLRNDKGYLPTDSLKFDSHSRPSSVSAEDFGKIKNQIVELAINKGCVALLYVAHHEIAKGPGLATTIKWGADHIISKFHNFLNTKRDAGIMILDRLSDTAEYSMLTEKFTTGLIYPDKTVPLERIKIFASSCDNASHLSSLADIVIGSFRYCINDPANFEASKVMMGNLVKLVWADKDKSGEHLYPFEKGLTFRPRPETVTIPQYKADYDLLLKHLNTLLA